MLRLKAYRVMARTPCNRKKTLAAQGSLALSILGHDAVSVGFAQERITAMLLAVGRPPLVIRNYTLPSITLVAKKIIDLAAGAWSL